MTIRKMLNEKNIPSSPPFLYEKLHSGNGSGNLRRKETEK